MSRYGLAGGPVGGMSRDGRLLKEVETYGAGSGPAPIWCRQFVGSPTGMVSVSTDSDGGSPRSVSTNA